MKKKLDMEDCKKCKQTKANCECHIPDQVKHAGLYSFCETLMKEDGLMDEMKEDWDKEQRAKKTYTGVEVDNLIDDLLNEVDSGFIYNGQSSNQEAIDEWKKENLK